MKIINQLIVLSALLSPLLPAAGSAAEDAPSETPRVGESVAAPAQWTLQVDPLTVAIGLVHVQVERTLTPDWSVYMGPHLRLFDGILDQTPQPYLGLGVEVGVRRYFAGHAPTGCWVLARGVVAYLTSSDPTPAASAGGYGSVLLGYTGILGGHFVLSGGLGAQYMAYRLGDYGFEGFFPAAHTALGVAF